MASATGLQRGVSLARERTKDRVSFSMGSSCAPDKHQTVPALNMFFDVARSARTAAWLYLMRRRQMDSARLRRYFSVKHQIEVGLYSYGCFDRWRMPGPMRIGRYCSIAASVRRVPRNHPIESMTTHPLLYEAAFGLANEDVADNEPLVIEDDVWIGHNVVILPRCRNIGRGAIIGAGSIITRNVAPYAVMAGNPGRKLRDRFDPDLIKAIEASRWWELSMDQLRQLAISRPDMVYSPTAEAIMAWARKEIP